MRTFLALAFLSVPLTGLGTIVLDTPFNSNMVLPARTRMTVSGYSTLGEEQTVTFSKSWNNNIFSVRTGKGGRFSFRIFTPPAGGPHFLSFADSSGPNTMLNVYAGIVLLVMGQSNAEMPLYYPASGYPVIPGGEQEANSANFPTLRYCRLSAAPSSTPVLRNPAYWKLGNEPNVGQLSAVGYYAAKSLHNMTGNPVGVIQITRGGSRIEEWMPRNLIATLPGGAEELEDEAADSYGTTYNGSMFPLRNFKFDAVIWYQGESNAQYASTYEVRLHAFLQMINSMFRARGRHLVKSVVEITPLTSGDANGRPWVRAIQNRISVDSQTFMVPSGDITDDISNPHPVDKQVLGYRIADLLREALGSEVAPSIPRLGTPTWNGDGSVSFPLVGGSPPYVLTDSGGFSFVNQQGNLVNATAVLDDNVVTVSNFTVVNPTGVRYLWQPAAQPTLFDSAGLPVNTFASDR